MQLVSDVLVRVLRDELQLEKCQCGHRQLGRAVLMGTRLEASAGLQCVLQANLLGHVRSRLEWMTNSWGSTHEHTHLGVWQIGATVCSGVIKSAGLSIGRSAVDAATRS